MAAGPILTWNGRGRAVVRDAATGRWRFGDRPEAPPRRAELAVHGAPATPPNELLIGDAFDAITLLEQTHANRIRLCYIDPPFNTGQEFSAYDDRAAHEVWLSGMEERIRAAYDLLCDGGFLCAHINVVEQAYLKVLLDEIFGRDRLVAQVAWQRAPDRTVLGQGSTLVADQVEYLLVYVRGEVPADWPRPQRRMPLSERTLETYSRTLTPSDSCRLVDTFTSAAGDEVKIFAHDGFTLAKRGPELAADFPRIMRLTNQQEESTFQQALLRRMPDREVLYRAEYVQRTGKHRGPRARWYLGGNVVLWLRDVAVLEGGRLIRVADLNNFWPADDIPATGIAREGGVVLRRGKKPERLLERVIGAFSRPGEWVLDFFAGSGTTGAVAQRLGRRWILVEAGPPARDLCEPRLAREIAKDAGGFRVARVV